MRWARAHHYVQFAVFYFCIFFNFEGNKCGTLDGIDPDMRENGRLKISSNAIMKQTL